MTRRAHCLAAAAMFLFATTASAQLVFDDGAEHRLSGTIDEQRIFVGNQSRLIADEITLPVESLISVDHADVEIRGGRTGSVELLDGNALVTGLVVYDEAGLPFEFDRGAAVVASGSSGLTLREGARIGGARGIKLNDNSQLLLEAGSVSGREPIVAQGSTTSRMTAGDVVAGQYNDFCVGPAIELGGEASFFVSGGLLQSCSLGVQTGGQAYFEMTGGMIVVSDTEPVQSAVVMRGRSSATLSGVHFNVMAPFQAGAILNVGDNAQLLVIDGRYESYEGEGGRNSFITSGGSSSIQIQGGDFDATYDFANAGSSLFFLHSSSRMEVTGGSFRLRQLPVDEDVQPIARIAHLIGTAAIDISGGSFTFEQTLLDDEMQGLIEHLRADDSSRIRVHGSDFNRPLGDVPDLEGSITGLLADGTRFDWSFRRAETARIVLVPEPEAIRLILLAVAFLWSQRRHPRSTMTK